MTNQLTFNDKALTPIIQNNQTWLTSRDLAKALDYKDASSVTRIYSRYKDEFTVCMTTTVNLTVTPNDDKETRIFSLKGCQLVAMLSKTQQAKAFRKWVLDILAKETAKTETQPTKNPYTSKHGFSRVIMVFRHNQLVDSYPVKETDGIVSFESPEILKEMIRDTMPGYALVNKKELSKAIGL